MKSNSTVLAEARKAAFKPGVFVQVLIFIGLFTAFFIGNQLLWETLIPGHGQGLFHLFILAPVILYYIIYVRFVERRSVYSMGFTRKGAVGKYLAGLAVGAGMMLAVWAICFSTGSIEANIAHIASPGLTIALFFTGYLIQGLSEEVIFRGYFMVSVANRAPVALAVGLSAMFFGLLHFIGRFLPLALINITLYGIFAGLYFLRTDSIWGIAALHSAWNFMQSNVFGFRIGGVRSVASLWSFGYNDNYLINGGGFGPEGGLAATAVFTAGIIILLAWPLGKKKCKQS